MGRPAYASPTTNGSSFSTSTISMAWSGGPPPPRQRLLLANHASSGPLRRASIHPTFNMAQASCRKHTQNTTTKAPKNTFSTQRKIRPCRSCTQAKISPCRSCDRCQAVCALSRPRLRSNSMFAFCYKPSIVNFSGDDAHADRARKMSAKVLSHHICDMSSR